MKKYSWIFALILALSMVFVFTGCPSPDDDPEPTPTPSPNPNPNPNPNPEPEGETEVAIHVKLGSTSVETTVIAGNNGSLTAENDTFTYTYGTVENSAYGNAFSRFKVDLGTTNYAKVKFTWTGIAGDVAVDKRLYLLASADETAITPWKSDTLIKGMVVSSTNIASFYDGDGPFVTGTDPQEVELNIYKADLRGEVWFAVYVHAEAVKSGVTSVFSIGDIEFVAGATPTPPAPPPPEPPTAAEPPEGADAYSVDITDWDTKGAAAYTNADVVPEGEIDEDGNLVVKFTLENQRVNFKLGDEIIEALKGRGDDNVTVIIEGEVIEDGETSGDSFRYHIGDATLGSNWNVSTGSNNYKGTGAADIGVRPLSHILATTLNFNQPSRTDNGYFSYLILQHMSANEVTIKIESITIYVLAEEIVDVAITVDGAVQKVVPVGVGADVALTNGKGYAFTLTNGYRDGFAYFQVDLGDDTIADFTSIEFTVSGTANYKDTGLIVSNDAFTAPIMDSSAEANLSKNWGNSGYGSGSQNLTITFDAPNTASSGFITLDDADSNEPYLCIYLHSATDETYTISNIKLVKE